MSEGALYLVMVLATADDGCPFPKDEEHASLVFVQAETQGEAEDMTLTALHAGHWSNARVTDSAPVLVDVDTHPGVTGDAMRYARQHGFAIVTYPE